MACLSSLTHAIAAQPAQAAFGARRVRHQRLEELMLQRLGSSPASELQGPGPTPADPPARPSARPQGTRTARTAVKVQAVQAAAAPKVLAAAACHCRCRRRCLPLLWCCAADPAVPARPSALTRPRRRPRRRPPRCPPPPLPPFRCCGRLLGCGSSLRCAAHPSVAPCPRQAPEKPRLEAPNYIANHQVPETLLRPGIDDPNRCGTEPGGAGGGISCLPAAQCQRGSAVAPPPLPYWRQRCARLTPSCPPPVLRAFLSWRSMRGKFERMIRATQNQVWVGEGVDVWHT